jgi:hypothetical protein
MSLETKQSTLLEFGSRLRGSAGFPRRSLVAADSKSRISPLLFFKPISNVFDEETVDSGSETVDEVLWPDKSSRTEAT